MGISIRPLAILSIFVAPILADFLGPSYPTPVDLSSNQSHVAANWRNLTSSLNIIIHGENSTALSPLQVGIKNITFSIGLFSLNDPAAAETQFHYTSLEVATSPNGTHKVDGDSIYRIASVTKVFTVLAGLLTLNATAWETPLTELIPTLAETYFTRSGENDPIHFTQWDQVTPSALAAQIGGTARDMFPYGPGDLYLQAISAGVDPTTLGLPPANASDPQEATPCTLETLGGFCNATLYFQSAALQPPTFEPWTTPGYSDNSFALLGLVISAVTGRNLVDIYQQEIYDPLGLINSNASTPPVSEWDHSVIPGDPANGFAIDAGPLVSTGGLLSTTNDLAKLGVGILNSTLLPSQETRKWLKPISHTARLQFSVGRPWEIIRYTHPSGRVTDIYTKLGSSGIANAIFVIIPDYNAGFSILSATALYQATGFETLSEIAELVGDSIIPGLEAQAAMEAACNYVGTYTPATPSLNSSLTVISNHTITSDPGLVISSWISNSTDMIAKFRTSIGPTPWRLVPSIEDKEHERVGFWIVSQSDAPGKKSDKTFSNPGFIAPDWIDNDSVTYGGVGLGSFVFDIGDDGKATAVTPSVLRASWARVA